MEEMERITDQEKVVIEAINTRRRERDLSDLKKVLSSPEGRRFVWKLMSKAGIFHSSFSAEDRDALPMAFREGSRNLGLWILQDVMAKSPERFTQMQKEHSSDLKAEEFEEKKLREEKNHE